jgi:DNA-binding LytR/AlgR family response regulator
MFLDRFFYYVVAALLLFLFAQLAIDFSKERRQRISEKARADQLQLILNQKSILTNSENLKIKGAGKMELVPIKDIVYTKGAGDYVEIFMFDNTMVLHSGSLKELEKSLPATFLKVHRSYIVNTTQIVSLQRHASGTGQLFLENEQSIPVSRRIMPEVRKKLL